MTSKAEREAEEAAARKRAAAKKRAAEAEQQQEEVATASVTADAKGPRVSPNPDFQPGERLDTKVDDPLLANENTRRDLVEAGLKQRFVDTRLYPPTEAEIERQQEEAAAKEEAAARDAAERQFHRTAHAGDIETGIDGLLQVLYRRGLLSIPEIEAITGNDIPEAEEKQMEADRDAA